MNDKKHIDRLFQEKLKDFEATPDKAVWDKINSQLNQKKDNRKVIPIWWKLTGVAAALILLLTVGNLVFNDSETTTNVADTEKVDSNNKKVDEKNNDLVDSEKEKLEKSIDESSDDSLINDNEVIQPEISNKNKVVVNSDKSETQKNPIKSKSNQTNYQNKKANNNYLVNTDENDIPNPNTLSEQPSNVIKDPSLNQDNYKEDLVENKTTESNVIEGNISKDIINNKEQLVFDDEKEQISSNKGIVLNNDDNTEKEDILIVEQEKDKTPLTEDVIASNEDIIEKEIINRWQINPNVAPVYFNSLGKGSSIHEQLVNNEKSGEINMSYGVNVSYAVNNKLSVKSGVNRVNLGYSTNDIIVYDNADGIVANTDLFRNIDLGERMPQSSFLSGNSLSLTQSPSILPNKSTALLKQEMTYYEIPLEVKYKLSDKKFGVSLVGGFSTFILNDNNVSYELEGVNTELGEAGNLNNTSFSANFGFGLDFNVSKNMNFNLDPMFKYQINTFSNTSGDFQPYFIGVYSGINIKF